MRLIDSHCHIHEAYGEYGVLGTETQRRYIKAGSPSAESMILAAKDSDVDTFICIGTTLEDSKLAVRFAETHDNVYATIGLHPHEAKDYVGKQELLDDFTALTASKKVVGIGECGLDYYYNNSDGAAQETILRFQLELGRTNNLPLSFHVRDAFEDFWRIFDDYTGIRGVIHSFSSNKDDLEAILERDLLVGINGIATFTKDEQQIAAIRAIPLDKILLETDAPFLTPAPFRGKLCEPKHVRVTAEFLGGLRGESLEAIARQTTINVIGLFNLKDKNL